MALSNRVCCRFPIFKLGLLHLSRNDAFVTYLPVEYTDPKVWKSSLFVLPGESTAHMVQENSGIYYTSLKKKKKTRADMPKRLRNFGLGHGTTVLPRSSSLCCMLPHSKCLVPALPLASLGAKLSSDSKFLGPRIEYLECILELLWARWAETSLRRRGAKCAKKFTCYSCFANKAHAYNIPDQFSWSYIDSDSTSMHFRDCTSKRALSVFRST